MFSLLLGSAGVLALSPAASAFVPALHAPLPKAALPFKLRETRERRLRGVGQLVAKGDVGADALGGPNYRLISSLLIGEAIVLAGAQALSFVTGVDPFVGSGISSLADPAVLSLAILAAQPPFIGSVLLERSNVPFFKRIDQDTRLYVLQLFGARRALPSVIAVSVALAVSAGVAEEALFRGVIQQGLTGVLGPWGALLVAAALFGLAHDPVPGASAVVEAVYGVNFGIVYLVSGGNLWAAALCHAVYDVLTFGEVHWRAAGRVQEALEAGALSKGGPVRGSGPAKGKANLVMDGKVNGVVREYKLAPEFVRVCGGVFQQLDLNGSGSIDVRELQLGLRTLSGSYSEKEAADILKRADTNGDGELSFDEFLGLIARNAQKAQAAR